MRQKIRPGVRLVLGNARSLWTYSQKVLSLKPIAYWPLWEAAGTAVECLVNPAQNGTAVGVTWADALTPMGTPAPFFDGANDLIDVFSATLAAAFSGSEGSLLAWTKTNGVGPWTDGTYRYAVTVRRDVDNRLYASKSDINNTIYSYHEGNNVPMAAAGGGHSETAWTPWVMTWSVAGGTVKHYVAGVLDAESAPGVTAWTGAPIIACIGGYTGPAVVWHGWLAHCALWNRPLTPAEIADLATV